MKIVTVDDRDEIVIGGDSRVIRVVEINERRKKVKIELNCPEHVTVRKKKDRRENPAK